MFFHYCLLLCAVVFFFVVASISIDFVLFRQSLVPQKGPRNTYSNTNCGRCLTLDEAFTKSREVYQQLYQTRAMCIRNLYNKQNLESDCVTESKIVSNTCSVLYEYLCKFEFVWAAIWYVLHVFRLCASYVVCYNLVYLLRRSNQHQIWLHDFDSQIIPSVVK